ncbi:hypothetical protein L6164_017516 [Bauhinia variegata]|uniref:Uncharacterized protein n=1 Tax=Bauhinia variegata TaxID=167791 RepID=A0ACB9N811_BAUVA|nr:hypothetical protein L6164_017516 [Bauhinia variegata]
MCHCHRQEGLDGGTIAGISVGVAALLLFLVCIFVGYYWRKERGYGEMLSAQDMKDTTSGNVEYETFVSGGPVAGSATGITSIMVDKSVEFLYEELANATDNFSVANKIGQGGFGAVYYEELRGEKVAIKKMEMKASKEFIAEVKVLMNVHHLIVLVSSTNVLVCYIFYPRGHVSMVTMVSCLMVHPCFHKLLCHSSHQLGTVARKESLSSVLLTLSAILGL